MVSYILIQKTMPSKVICSSNNIKIALEAIGKVDPFKIRRTTKKRVHPKKRKDESRYTRNNYIQRGILSVGKVIKSKPFSNNMVKKLFLRQKVFDKKTYWMKVYAKMYYSIIFNIFNILVDDEIRIMLNREQAQIFDKAIAQCSVAVDDDVNNKYFEPYTNMSMRTVAPIQSYIIMNSNDEFKKNEIKKLKQSLSEKIYVKFPQ